MTIKLKERDLPPKTKTNAYISKMVNRKLVDILAIEIWYIINRPCMTMKSTITKFNSPKRSVFFISFYFFRFHKEKYRRGFLVFL